MSEMLKEKGKSESKEGFAIFMVNILTTFVIIDNICTMFSYFLEFLNHSKYVVLETWCTVHDSSIKCVGRSVFSIFTDLKLAIDTKQKL